MIAVKITFIFQMSIYAVQIKNGNYCRRGYLDSNLTPYSLLHLKFLKYQMKNRIKL